LGETVRNVSANLIDKRRSLIDNCTSTLKPSLRLEKHWERK